ncbi:MAG: hypothetical protein LBU06_03610 [Desulfovibrio sp.]|jgi:hypothetical protein|nr:hypothetical protein [Desulfovibrio sp.]
MNTKVFIKKTGFCQPVPNRLAATHGLIKPEQFHFEIALAVARADARREGASAIYLRG